MRNFILIVALATYCGCNEKNISFPEVINVDFEENSVLKLSLIADSVSIINLESKDNTLISNVIRITRAGENFLICGSSGTHRKLVMYDKKGKYLCAFGGIGRGPGEYVALTSYIYDDIKREVSIYDQTSRAILIYDLDGTFKRKIQTNFIFEDFSITDEGKLLIYSNVESANMVNGEKLPRGTYLIDEEGNYISTIHSIDSQDRYQFFNQLQFSKSERNPLLISTFDDKIYTYSGGKFTSKYELNFGEFTLSAKERTTIDVENLAGERVVYKGMPAESTDFLYFPVAISGSMKVKHCLLNKSKMECIIFDKFENDIIDLSTSTVLGGSRFEFYSIISDTNPSTSETMMGIITQILIIHLKSATK